MNRIRPLSAVLAVFLCANSALAYLSVSSGDLAAPAVIDFSQFVVQVDITPGKQVGGLVGEDVFLTAVGHALVGPMNHGLGVNGGWTRTGALIDDDFNGVLTFKFNDGPVRAAGGFVNYCVECGNPARMDVLDSGGNVLEGYNLEVDAPINTPGGVNAGAFRGIVRPTNDISALRLSYAFQVIDDLAFTRTIPEPSSAVLALFACAGYAARTRQRARA